MLEVHLVGQKEKMLLFFLWVFFFFTFICIVECQISQCLRPYNCTRGGGKTNKLLMFASSPVVLLRQETEWKRQKSRAGMERRDELEGKGTMQSEWQTTFSLKFHLWGRPVRDSPLVSGPPISSFLSAFCLYLSLVSHASSRLLPPREIWSQPRHVFHCCCCERDGSGLFVFLSGNRTHCRWHWRRPFTCALGCFLNYVFFAIARSLKNILLS